MSGFAANSHSLGYCRDLSPNIDVTSREFVTNERNKYALVLCFIHISLCLNKRK